MPQWRREPGLYGRGGGRLACGQDGQPGVGRLRTIVAEGAERAVTAGQWRRSFTAAQLFEFSFRSFVVRASVGAGCDACRPSRSRLGRPRGPRPRLGKRSREHVR